MDADALGRSVWQPSYTQLERLETSFRVSRQNDVVSCALVVHGVLDRVALQDACHLLAQRHPTLTSTFGLAGNDIVMVPGSANIEFAWHSIELSAVKRQVHELRIRPFDLACGPLFRIAVFEKAADEHLVLLVADHIVMDARSLSITLRDLWCAYASLVGQDSVYALPELPRTYGDWTRWERDRLRGRRLTRLTDFWTKTLRELGPLPGSGLVDHQAEIVHRPPGLCRLRPDAAVTARILKVSRQCGATAAVTISALVKSAVYHYRKRLGTDNDDGQIAVFGAFSNRLPAWVDHLVGYFANSAVVCSDLSGDPTLGELIGRESRVLFRVALHQDMPHALLVKSMRPDLYGIRYRVPTGAVPKYLNFDTPDLSQIAISDIDGLRIERAPLPVLDQPRGGLRVRVNLSETRPVLDFRYDHSVYRDEWVHTLTTGAETIMSQWTAAPLLRLADVDPFHK